MPLPLTSRLSVRLTALLLLGGLLPAVLVGIQAQRLLSEHVHAEADERRRRLAERGEAIVLDAVHRAEDRLRTLGRLLARELTERQVGSYGVSNEAYRDTVLARLNGLVEPPDVFLELQYFSGGPDPQLVGLVQQSDYRAQLPLGAIDSVQQRFDENLLMPLVQEPLLNNRGVRERELRPFGEYLTLRLSAPVSATDEPDGQEVLGALVAHMDFAALSGLLQALLVPGETLQLADGAGTELIGLGASDGEERLHHARAIEALDWELRVSESRSRVEEPLLRLRHQGLRALGLALGLSLSLGLFAALRVTRPLAALRRTTEAMGRGDLSARTGLRRSDEIGSLARSFDHMAEELSRLDEAKSAFVGNVSHELRTPLTGMRLAVANLLDGVVGELDEAQRATLLRLSGDLDRLIALTTSLLELARLEAGAVQPARERVELGAFAQEVLEAARAARPEPVRLELEGEGGVVLADPLLLRRVLENLLDNAIKFGPPGGRVLVELDGEGFAVQDEGPGVGELELFERFRQGEAQGVKNAGVGLGLALCKQMVELMEGTLTVENRGGARFQLRLPRIA